MAPKRNARKRSTKPKASVLASRLSTQKKSRGERAWGRGTSKKTKRRRSKSASRENNSANVDVDSTKDSARGADDCEVGSDGGSGVTEQQLPTRRRRAAPRKPGRKARAAPVVTSPADNPVTENIENEGARATSNHRPSVDLEPCVLLEDIAGLLPTVDAVSESGPKPAASAPVRATGKVTVERVKMGVGVPLGFVKPKAVAAAGAAAGNSGLNSGHRITPFLKASRVLYARPTTARRPPSPEKDSDEDMDGAGVLSGTEAQQLDRDLHMKAAKARISVKNVKSMIKRIISDEQVQAMMQYTMAKEADPKKELPAFEATKMTRSRARQLLAESALTEAPLTPVKRASEQTEQLVHHEFPEDDDDEEYTPRKAESAQSSPLSSPAPSTPCSSLAAPQTPTTPASAAAEEPLSKRTRSRLPLTDQALESLEQMLEAPDVTPDMYNPVVDDDDWSDFLRAFNMPLDKVQGQEEDDEDEEYVFQVNEDEEVERDEFRGGPGSIISRKEVSNLMKELFQDVNDLQHQLEVPPVKRRYVPFPHQSQADPPEVTEPPPPAPLAVMSDRQARLLDFQMTAHVQLLAQTYVLCAEQPWLATERAGAATLLVELNTLSRSLRSEDPTQSFFHPPNLAPALQVCADWDKIPIEELTGPGASKVFKGEKRYCRFSQRLVDTVLDSKAFVFHSMLPATVPLVFHPQAKHNISIHLDQLIAMGLEQFMPYANAFLTKGRPSLKSVYKLISKHMVPLPARRIKTRVDWVRWTRMVNNPIYIYFDTFRTPPVEPPLLVPKYPLVTMRNRWKAKLPEPWRTLHRPRKTRTELYFTVGARDCSHMVKLAKVFKKVPSHVMGRKATGKPRSSALAGESTPPQPKKRPVKVAVTGVGIVSGLGAPRLPCPSLSSSSSGSDSEYETDYDDPRYEDPDGICYDHEQGEEDWAAGRSAVTSHSWPEAPEPIKTPPKVNRRKRKVQTKKRKVPVASASKQAQSVRPAPSTGRCRTNSPVVTLTPLTPVSSNSRGRIISKSIRLKQALCSTDKENDSPEAAEQSRFRPGDTSYAGKANSSTGNCASTEQRSTAGRGDILAMCMTTITDSLPGMVSDSVDMTEPATAQEVLEHSDMLSLDGQGHLRSDCIEDQRGVLSRRDTLLVTGSDLDNPCGMPNDSGTVWNVTGRPNTGSHPSLPASSSEAENVTTQGTKDANDLVKNTNVAERSRSPASDSEAPTTGSNGANVNSQPESHASGSSVTKPPAGVTSTIELKEEDGQLVMYIRTSNPARPEVRLPVRAAPGATRLTLPPSLAWSALGRGQPAATRATGVVAPTVRQPPAPAGVGVLTDDAAGIDGGPPGSTPAQLQPRPAAEPSSSETVQSVSAPASPVEDLAEQPPPCEDSQTSSLDGGLFKLPFAPLRSVRRTMLPPGAVSNQSSMESAAESVGAGAAVELFVSDAALPTAGEREDAGSSTTNTDVNSGPLQAPSAVIDDDSQSVSLPGGISWSQSPPHTSSELQLPAMMPPALMTPGRGSPQQQLCLGFPTPLETPAAGGPDLSDLQTPLPLCTPHRRSLDTPLIPPSPARQWMLETPQIQRSPVPEVHTPPRQGNGETLVSLQDAGSADAGSDSEKRFFQQVGKDVKSKPPEPTVSKVKPGPELMSEQSLGGILEQLLARPGTEHQEVPESDAAPGSSTPDSRKLVLQVQESEAAPGSSTPDSRKLVLQVQESEAAPGPSTPDSRKPALHVPESDAASGSSTPDSRKPTHHVPESVASESARLSAEILQEASSETVRAVEAVALSAETASSVPAEEPSQTANTEALPSETAAPAPAAATSASLSQTAPSPVNPRAAKTVAATRIRTRSESASPAQKKASSTAASGSTGTKAAEHRMEEKSDQEPEANFEEASVKAILQRKEGRESSAQPLASAATAPPVGRSRSKRSRQQREAELPQLALAPDSQAELTLEPESQAGSHPDFAYNFHRRVKESTESIDPAIYEQFSKLLAAFSEAGPAGDQVALYDGARRLLRGFPELLEEFLGMLDPQVAVEHLRANNTTQLVRRIENVHAGHPMQIQKVLRPPRIIDISSTEATETSQAPVVAVDPTASPPSKRARRKPPAAKSEKSKKTPGSGAGGGATVKSGTSGAATSKASAAGAATSKASAAGAATSKASAAGAATSKMSAAGAATSKASAAGKGTSKASAAGAATSMVSTTEGAMVKASATEGAMVKASATGAATVKVSGPGSGDCASAGGASLQTSPCAASLDEPSWSREEDLEILTSCQKSGDGEKTFRAIQRRLPRRSLQQLQKRFQHLIDILCKQLQAAEGDV